MGNQCCSSGGGSNLEPLQRYFDVPLTTLCAFEGSLLDAEVPPAELFHTEAEEGSLERGKKGHSKRLTLKAMIGAGGHWSSVTRQALNIRNSHVSATYHSVPQLVSDLCSLAVELCPKLPSARSDAVTLFISVDLRRMASSVTQPWISNLKQGIDHTFQTDRQRWKQWAQRERSQMKAVEHRRTMTSDPVMQLVRGWEPSTARVLALLAFFFRSLPSPLLPPTVVSELHSMFNATYDSTDAIRNAICLREAVCRYWREVFAVTFPIAYCVIERLAETFAVLSGVPLNASAANPHREEQWRTTLDGWLLQSGWIAEVQEDAEGHGRGHGGRHGGPSDHRVHHSELYGYIAEWVFMLQRDTPVMTTLEEDNNTGSGSATMNATAPSKESETTTAGTGSGGNTRNEQVASSTEQQQQQRALESDQITSKAASEPKHTGTRGGIIAEEAVTMASPLITSTSHGPTTAGAPESVKRKETSTSLGNAAHDAPRGATSPEASPPEDTTTKGTATPIASANRTPHLTHVRHVDSAVAVMSDMEEDNAGRNEGTSKEQQRQQQQMDHHGVGVRSCSSSIAPVSEFSVVAPRLEVTERGRFSEAPDPSTSKSAAAVGDRRSTSQTAAGSSALATLRLAKQVFSSGSEELPPMHSNQEDDHHQERPHGDNLSASAVSESQAHQSSTGHIPLISSFGGEFDVIRNFMLEASEAMSDLNKELEAVRQQQQHVTVLVEQGMASRPFRDNVQRVIAELATTTADNGDEILKLRRQIKELEESLQHANMDRDRLAADAAAARFSAQEVLLKWADMDRLMLHHDQALKYHERKQADTQDALQQLATHYKSLQVDMDTMQRRMMMLRGSI